MGKTPARALTWKQTRVKNLTVITGTEDLLCERTYQIIRNALQQKFGDELERVELDATGYTAGAIATAASPSLFSAPKLLHITSAGSGNEQFYKELEQLQSLEPDLFTVVEVGSGRRGKKALDALKAAGQWIECKELKWDNEKTDLVKADVHAAGRKITPDAAEALVSAVGSTARELASATAQLLADIPGDIDETAVKRYYQGFAQTKTFDVADAVVRGHMGNALVTFRQCLDSGNKPVAIVAAIAYKLRALAKAVDGYPDDSTSPYAARKLHEQARGWNSRAVAAAISAAAAADAGVKGESKDAAGAVEKCIITCCRLKHGRI